VREIRDLSALLGVEALAASPFLHPHPQDAKSGGIFLFGIIAICVAVVLFAIPILGRLFRISAPSGRALSIEVGNSAEFDAIDAEEIPDEWRIAFESFKPPPGIAPPKVWISVRKLVRVDNHTKRLQPECRANITHLEPRHGNDVLPAALVWRHTGTETCDIAPYSHAYAVVWHLYTFTGLTHYRQPLQAFLTEPDVRITVGAWNAAVAAKPRRLRMEKVQARHGNHPMITAEDRPITQAVSWAYVRLSELMSRKSVSRNR
jgi:hypothetical protein